MSASALTAADRTALKEVVAEKVGNVCGANVASVCTSSDVTVVVFRRAVTVSYSVAVYSAAAASSGAQAISLVSTGAMTSAIQAKTMNLASASVTAVTSTTTTPAPMAHAEDAGSAGGDSFIVIILVVVGVLLFTIAGIACCVLRRQSGNAKEAKASAEPGSVQIEMGVQPKSTAAGFDDLMSQGQQWADCQDSGQLLSDVCGVLAGIGHGVPVVGGVVAAFFHGMKALGEQMRELGENAEMVKSTLEQLIPFSAVMREIVFNLTERYPGGELPTAVDGILTRLNADIETTRLIIQDYCNKSATEQFSCAVSFPEDLKKAINKIDTGKSTLNLALTNQIDDGVGRIDKNTQALLDMAKKKTEKEKMQDNRERCMLKHIIMADMVTKEPINTNFYPDGQSWSGASGEVYIGKYVGTVVAVKQVKFTGNQRERKSALHEFERELAVMCELRHPNVISVYGYIDCDNSASLVMDFARRGELRKVIENVAIPLPPQQVISMALDGAQGLAYAHGMGVLHRDVKSLNMFVTEDWRVKIGDFGRATSAGATTCVGGQGSGHTPAWTCPEHYDDAQYTSAGDVYSFGIVMWELATRQFPWSDMPPMKIMHATCDGRRPDTQQSLVNGPFDGEYRKIMEHCWAHDCDDRPEFAAVVRMLEKVLYSFNL